MNIPESEPSIPQTLPRQIPVMTLSGCVLFPQAMQNLYIFEPRYRKMLSDVLKSHKMFAIAKLDEGESESSGQEEPPHQVATVGLVVETNTNADGTSYLSLQGVSRVRIKSIVQEDPYRIIEVDAISSETIPDPAFAEQKSRLLTKMAEILELSEIDQQEVLPFFEILSDPEHFLNIACQHFCEESGVKQKFLEIDDLQTRMNQFQNYVDAKILKLELAKKFKGSVDEGGFNMN